MKPQHKKGVQDFNPWNPDKYAVSKVYNFLPEPEECPHCGGAVALVNNCEIYHGKSYGSYPWSYICIDCKAYVGLHPNTAIPLGTLATLPMRKARKKAKTKFIVLTTFVAGGRSIAYKLLASAMGIHQGVCHIAWFDEIQCKHAIKVMDILIEKYKE
jgi:hypothetical protein